jgi:hypothetical protein
VTIDTNTKISTYSCLEQALKNINELIIKMKMKRIVTLSLASALMVTALLASTQSAHAQAPATLIFSGGSGTPLTMILASPVTYTVTTPPTTLSPIFIFQGVGNIFATNPSITSTLTFSINGGAAQTFNTIGSGFTGVDLVANDIYVFGSFSGSGVSVGDTVLLSAGALTTTSNIAAAAPAPGAYTTFISDSVGNRISGISSVAAPEPASLSLLALGGIIAIRKRRKQA